MKKITISLAFLIILFSSKAQTTITQTDVGSIGDTIYVANDTVFVGSLFFGDTGLAQIWDYSFLTPMLSDTLYFKHKDSTSSGSLVTNANLALEERAQVSYLIKNSTSLSVKAITFDLGMADSSGRFDSLIMRYNPTIKLMNFPMQFGDIHSSTATGKISGYYGDTIDIPGTGPVYVDSFRINDNVQIEDTIDGDGALLLPSGSYNCIRQKIIQVRTTDIEIRTNVSPFPQFPIWVWLPVFSFGDRQTDYNWIANGYDFPLLSISLDSSDIAYRTRYQLLPNNVGINQNITESSVQIFPNPTVGKVHVKIDNWENTTIKISTILGKECFHQPILSNVSIIDLEKYPSGLYFISINKENERVITQKIIKK